MADFNLCPFDVRTEPDKAVQWYGERVNLDNVMMKRAFVLLMELIRNPTTPESLDVIHEKALCVLKLSGIGVPRDSAMVYVKQLPLTCDDMGELRKFLDDPQAVDAFDKKYFNRMYQEHPASAAICLNKFLQ